MPCRCDYEPSDQNKLKIHAWCNSLIGHIKWLESLGDPGDYDFNGVMKMLDHLYHGKCDEKESK